MSRLFPADSPRLGGEDLRHVELLAESGGPLPPILVHRSSMRVIDGMHRLRVAQLRGDQTIAVRFFDGSDDFAFVLSVAANIAHGLPLSLVDRRAAARRIVTSRPDWSDRAIAAATGLAAKTVKGIRQSATADLPQSNTRLGRDGRMRPVSAAEGRRVAGEIFAARPDVSLREVARIAGISTGTARDVRIRLSNGGSPVPGPPARPDQGPARSEKDSASILRALRTDPSLRHSNAGRLLLRWLHRKAVDRHGWRDLTSMVPGHCVGVVAELARACAHEWGRFADELEQRDDAPV
ncbi:ParB/RepB/Spo0J family partition protein [Amycolatopsis sp. FBCC-B4732]|uniref:ParB/RepB/Spo0J family partition protein n=1 Tax=Amycolatopsis sp. FBCC-B4732 TaxID=3079339 RepID=UPI001FF2F10D|nr:ParB/RepB/Spo0J family partition protein [Amycolatopsis sp. FBCC-B4732]UOX90690.1 ParB/RepB/Spo0J family partition protein [Amycolatopsis sp. FBCC-B4732]